MGVRAFECRGRRGGIDRVRICNALLNYVLYCCNVSCIPL